MKKDVKEYIRQSKKLDGNKSFKKTYVMDEDTSFRLELNGDEMKIFMLFKGLTFEKTTIGDMSNFDSELDSFIQETHKFINKMFEGYRDSFKEKMDEIIETDELFKPFTVKNKEDHGLDFEIEVAVVSCLVACLHVQEDEVVLAKGFNGCLRFSLVVGVV